jgi:hypothetical protein
VSQDTHSSRWIGHPASSSCGITALMIKSARQREHRGSRLDSQRRPSGPLARTYVSRARLTRIRPRPHGSGPIPRTLSNGILGGG